MRRLFLDLVAKTDDLFAALSHLYVAAFSSFGEKEVVDINSPAASRFM